MTQIVLHFYFRREKCRWVVCTIEMHNTADALKSNDVTDVLLRLFCLIDRWTVIKLANDKILF